MSRILDEAKGYSKQFRPERSFVHPCRGNNRKRQGVSTGHGTTPTPPLTHPWRGASRATFSTVLMLLPSFHRWRSSYYKRLLAQQPLLACVTWVGLAPVVVYVDDVILSTHGTLKFINILECSKRIFDDTSKAGPVAMPFVSHLAGMARKKNRRGVFGVPPKQLIAR